MPHLAPMNWMMMLIMIWMLLLSFFMPFFFSTPPKFHQPSSKSSKLIHQPWNWLQDGRVHKQ